MNVIEEIKSRYSLEQYIVSVTGKQFRGATKWKVLPECPFCGHKEFHFCSSSETAFCFSCHSFCGDVIHFRSLYENITYKEAIDLFREELGIKKFNKKDVDWVSIRESACEYLRETLHTCQTKYQWRGAEYTPLRYLTDFRKHSYEAIMRFRLGFNDGNLIQHLEKSYSAEVIKASGLTYIPDGTFVYPFLVGNEIKYFRTKDPNRQKRVQMPLSTRSKNALWYNQDVIKDGNEVWLCEGEDDVMSLYDCGIKAAGTYGNVTLTQINYIKSVELPSVYLCFDNDPAGKRDADMVIRNYENVNVFIIQLPEGKDIDDIVKEAEDKEALVEQLRSTAKLPTPESRTAIKQKTEGYYIDRVTRGGMTYEKRLTNWTIQLEAVIIRHDERLRKVRVKSGTYEDTIYMPGIFASVTRLREFLLNNCNRLLYFMGKDDDLSALVQYWEVAFDPKIVKESDCVGEIEEGFIADNIFISNSNEFKPLTNGFLSLDDKHSIRIIELVRRGNAKSEIPYFPLIEPAGGVENFKKNIYTLMLKNRNLKVALGIGWMKAVLWSSMFYDKFRFFPILMLHGKYAGGKCLAKGSKVLLGDGSYCNIEDFKGGEVASCLIDKIAPIESKKSFPNGIKDCYEIEIQTGRKLIATPNHPFLCLELNRRSKTNRQEAFRGKVKWVLLEDLYKNKNDYLVFTPRKIEVDNILTTNESEVIVLAYLLGDGSLRHKILTNSNPVLGNDFTKNAENLGYLVKKKKDKNTWGYQLQYKKKDRLNYAHYKSKFNLFLDDWGLNRKLKAGDKFIPEQIFRFKNELIAIFLNRLFSCDGWVDTYSNYARIRLGYCSKSYEMILGVSNLLLRFGIWGYIRQRMVKGKMYYNFDITDADCIRIFFEEIGMLKIEDDKKKKILSKLKGMKDIRSSKLPTSFMDNYNLEKIKNIEFVGKHETWDLTVDKTHNFIANNMVVHNTVFANWLMSFLGLRDCNPEMVSDRGTSEVGLARKLDFYSALPVFIDDYRNDDTGQRFHTFFRGIFNRSSATKGLKEEQGVRRVRIRGCLMITGETCPTDAALLSRLISIELTRQERLEKHYQELMKIEPEFASIGLSWLKDRTNGFPAFMEKYGEIEAILMKKIDDPRQASVWSVAIASALTEPIFKKDELISFAIKLANYEIQEHKGEEIIGTLWQATDILDKKNQLSKQSIAFHGYDKTILIHLPTLLSDISGNQSTSRKYDLPNHREVAKILKQEPYVLELKNARIDEKVAKRWILDWAKCPDILKDIFQPDSKDEPQGDLDI